MRVSLWAACSVIAVGLAVVGVTVVIKSHGDDPRMPSPASASPQFVSYLRQAQPLPRATGYDPQHGINIGPVVQSLNQSWSAYFGRVPGKPVVAVKGWGSAGVGLLTPGDQVYPMCGRDVMFDPAASTIIYCPEPFLPAGENPHSGNILVPNGQFMTALQDMGSGYVQEQLNVSLVAAFFYVSHIQYGLSSQHLATWQDGTAAQMCLAGVGAATLVPEAPSARQWVAALGFLHRFWHFPQLSSQSSELLLGYQSANPQKCFAGI